MPENQRDNRHQRATASVAINAPRMVGAARCRRTTRTTPEVGASRTVRQRSKARATWRRREGTKRKGGEQFAPLAGSDDYSKLHGRSYSLIRCDEFGSMATSKYLLMPQSNLRAGEVPTRMWAHMAEKVVKVMIGMRPTGGQIAEAARRRNLFKDEQRARQINYERTPAYAREQKIERIVAEHKGMGREAAIALANELVHTEEMQAANAEIAALKQQIKDLHRPPELVKALEDRQADVEYVLADPELREGLRYSARCEYADTLGKPKSSDSRSGVS